MTAPVSSTISTAPRTTTPIPPECTYRPTATKWHTAGCEFNCPSRYYLAVDCMSPSATTRPPTAKLTAILDLAPIPCGCSDTRVAVRPTTTTVCYTAPNCPGQWDVGWMVGRIAGTRTDCPATGTTAGVATTPTTETTATSTVAPVGRMFKRQM